MSLRCSNALVFWFPVPSCTGHHFGLACPTGGKVGSPDFAVLKSSKKIRYLAKVMASSYPSSVVFNLLWEALHLPIRPVCQRLYGMAVRNSRAAPVTCRLPSGAIATHMATSMTRMQPRQCRMKAGPRIQYYSGPLPDIPQFQ